MDTPDGASASRATSGWESAEESGSPSLSGLRQFSDVATLQQRSVQSSASKFEEEMSQANLTWQAAHRSGPCIDAQPTAIQKGNKRLKGDEIE